MQHNTSRLETDELIALYEKEMGHDQYGFLPRRRRSSAMQELKKREASVLAAIADHLSESIALDPVIETAWRCALRDIGEAIEASDRPEIFEPTSTWINWARKHEKPAYSAK